MGLPLNWTQYNENNQEDEEQGLEASAGFNWIITDDDQRKE